MKEYRTRKVSAPSLAQTLLILVVLLSILPLYGLYLKDNSGEQTGSSPLHELKSAAVALKRVGAFKSAAGFLWSMYERTPEEANRLEVLQVLRELYQQERNHEDLLRVLYLIQALDPSESRVSYRKEVYETLGRLGKDKDASLFLKTQSGLKKSNPEQGSSNLVVAQVGGEEIYYRDVKDLLKGNAAEKQQKLFEFIVQRILKSESMGLMQTPEFISQANDLVEELRVAQFLKQKFKKQEISEFDLKNYFQSHLYQWNHGKGYLVSHLMLSGEGKLKEYLDSEIKNRSEFEAYARAKSDSLDKIRSGIHTKWIEDDSIPQVGRFKGLFKFLESQAPGEVSSVFKSRRGQHFFWIRESRAPKSSQFADVRQEVYAAYQKEFEKQFKQDYFRELVRENQVRIYSDRL